MTDDTIELLDQIKTYRTLSEGGAWPTDARKLTIAELADLGREKLYSYGFGNWDEHLILLPEWVFPYMVDGETFTAIDGEQAIKGKDHIDLDTRFGCIAYGFVI